MGLIEASVTGDSTSLIKRAKEQSLLALLALNAGRVVAIDRLIDGLWGDHPPRTAAKTLQTYVKNLRVHLDTAGVDRAVLSTEPPGYVLRVPTDAVDVLRFEQTCAAADASLRAGEPAEAARLYRQALAEVGAGDFSAFDAPGLEGARVRFLEQRRQARDAHHEARLSIGTDASLVADLQHVVEAEPQNEQGVRTTHAGSVSVWPSARRA